VSTIKSSAEDLTLNADGANNDIILQSNASTVVTVDGSATSVGINETAPLGFLHVKNGDSGQGSINAAGNSLILESSGGAGITFLTGSSSNGSIIWGDSESNYQGVILYDHSASAMKFITSGTERMRVIDDGLTFNGDTAAANALDDYEEGTWTPTAQSGLASLTCTGTCAYTKIGNICYINAGIGFGGSGAGSGDVEIAGLPFASVNDSAMRGCISIFAEGLAGNIGQGTSGFVQSNASYIRIRENGTTASGSSMGAKFDTGSGIMLNFSYRVA